MLRNAAVIGSIVTAVALAALGRATPATPSPTTSTTMSFGHLPLTFEKNTGRYDKQVRFLTRTGGVTLFITETEMVMVRRGKASGEGREASASPTGSPSPGGRGSGGGGVAHGLDGTAPSPLPTSRVGGIQCLPTPARGGGDDTITPSALGSRLSTRSHVLRMKLVGGQKGVVASGLDKQPGIVNYFIGNDP